MSDTLPGCYTNYGTAYPPNNCKTCPVCNSCQLTKKLEVNGIDTDGVELPICSDYATGINFKMPISEAQRRAIARYYAKNKDDPEFKKRNSENARKWQIENKERYNNYKKEYNRKRAASDPEFRKANREAQRRWRERHLELWKKRNAENQRKHREKLKKQEIPQ